jgi:hypothetical protein
LPRPLTIASSAWAIRNATVFVSKGPSVELVFCGPLGLKRVDGSTRMGERFSWVLLQLMRNTHKKSQVINFKIFFGPGRPIMNIILPNKIVIFCAGIIQHVYELLCNASRSIWAKI